ncbi:MULTISPECIES: hypothetical protein [Mesorhizobium]|uniref:hypothetical protein n=1 Tax=Mesorhizobium TaxID=68287 RepID=UPI000415D0A6|nr:MULTISPECIES: hypothetical protein [Mesorhizobium]WJI38615.1 hypothetical protein NL534_33480 [Mesorhizobium opportunistum]
MVGYNSISFDEELLRRAFYSSLLPIYLTNTGGNSRLDIMPLAIAAHTFAPEGFNWPINEKGRTSFKLDRLAPANGFEHSNAHDALADVYATIHIARLIKDRAPVVWESAMAYRSKATATQYVELNSVFVATRLRFGLCSSFLVTAIGTNPDNSGEVFLLDLREDPAALLAMTDEELAAYIATKPRPISSLKLNASPLFMPIESVGEKAPGYALGLEEIARRAELVRSDEGLRQRLISVVLQGRTPFQESPHLEEQIYGSFYSRSDQSLIDGFREASWPRRFELSRQFDDRRLRGLSGRLVYIDAPHVMPANMRADYARAIAARIHSRTDRSGRWTTLDEAIEEGQEMLTDAPVGREAILQEHLARLTAWHEEVGLILHDPE